jgi:hypothetical protein
MKYFLVFALALAVGVVSSRAQQAPDNDAILAAINDGSSPYYYPSLMLRYGNGDRSLTADDYRYLYYGFAFQSRYNPTATVIGTDDIWTVLERSPEPDAEAAGDIIRFARQVMMQDPFSPSNVNYLTFAYAVLGDTINERVNADRFDKILSTIESSGTGLSEKSPWHILWFSHANDMLAAKGFEIRKRIVVSRSVEYIEVEKNDQGVKGFYFDFSRIYWKKPEDTPKKEKGNGFLLNGIRIR